LSFSVLSGLKVKKKKSRRKKLAKSCVVHCR
jgi:hypothetical protein